MMCTCASCSYTDSFAGWVFDGEKYVPDTTKGGFANWPRGNPAGKRSSEASYRAHVAHLWQGISRQADYTKGAGAGWYGTPAGMTRAEVDRVLRETFAKAQDEEAATVTPITPKRLSLVQLARELRKAA